MSNPFIRVLRHDTTENAYRVAQENHTVPGLEAEPSLREWKHWRLIDNRFPYDRVFQEHHMLVPRRRVAQYSDFTMPELMELDKIIREFCEVNYDALLLNMISGRSVLDMFHLHVARYLVEPHQSKEE